MAPAAMPLASMCITSSFCLQCAVAAAGGPAALCQLLRSGGSSSKVKSAALELMEEIVLQGGWEVAVQVSMWARYYIMEIKKVVNT